MKTRPNLIGEKFHYLIINSLEKDTKYKGYHWAICTCTLCGKINFRTQTRSVIGGRTKSCGCMKAKFPKLLGENSNCFTGLGQIRGQTWAKIKRKAAIRSLEFNITLEYAWCLYLEQSGLCALSGQPIHFGRSGHNKETTASLDRKDSTRGYTEDNVQWVQKDINLMKRTLTDEEFINYCKQVAQFRG